MRIPRQTMHGGRVREGRRKIARPLCTRRMLHVVYRSSRARGPQSFLLPKNSRRIAELLDQTVAETAIELKRFVNVGNHVHLLIRGRTVKSIQRFLRLFPQRVALALGGAKKGAPKGRFFDQNVFTRVVDWGIDYANVTHYLIKNALEAMGYPAAEVRAMHRALRTLPVNKMLYLANVMYRGDAAARIPHPSLDTPSPHPLN